LLELVLNCVHQKSILCTVAIEAPSYSADMTRSTSRGGAVLAPSRSAFLVVALGFTAVTLPKDAIANPALVQGVWKEITPPTVTTGAAETCIGQGIAIDRKAPSTIYWGTTPFTDALGGLFKTTDGGSTWSRIAKITPAWQGASDHLDMPLHIEIDPKDSNHLYAGDGVRGT